MPRWPTHPDTIGECRIISMTSLKQMGYLVDHVSGSLSWSSNGKPSGNISIEVKVYEPPRYLRVSYTLTKASGEKTKLDYQIPIEVIPSNLGKGHRYYFRCPFTDKRCLKLYQVPSGSVFAHREYWSDLYYQKQLTLKSWRLFQRSLDLHDQIRNTSMRYMKTHYRDKITPRYKAYLSKVQTLERLEEMLVTSHLMSSKKP